MDYKRKADEIRLCIFLIRERRVSNTLRQRKLNEIADLSEMYNYSDTLKTEFVKESMKLQKFNKQVEWIRYYEKILLGSERYELLSQLSSLFK